MYGAETFDAQLYPRTKTGKRGICEVEGCYGQAVMRTDDGCRCAVFQGFWRCANHHPGHDGVYIVTGQTLRNMGWDGTSPLPQVESFGAETHFVDCHYCGRNIDLYDETNDSISCDECGKIACGSYKCNYSKNPKETWEEFTCGECVTGMDAESESATYEPSNEPDMASPATEPTNENADLFGAECMNCKMAECMCAEYYDAQETLEDYTPMESVVVDDTSYQPAQNYGAEFEGEFTDSVKKGAGWGVGLALGYGLLTTGLIGLAELLGRRMNKGE